MIVYHGSTLQIKNPDLTHSKYNLDFGVGFYTTTISTQAERWAKRKGMRLSLPAVVNVYEIDDFKSFRVKRFDGADKEWLQFVVDCRNGSEVYKNYDIIIGNVADDDVFKCVNMFMDSIWDEERTLKEISFFEKNDQIAFLSQQAIDDLLRFKESYEVTVDD